MTRAKLASKGLILCALGATIMTMGNGIAGADPVVNPLEPGVPIPNSVVTPWEGGGSSILTPDSGFAPDLEDSGGNGQQVMGGGTGFVCNNQGVTCPWGTS